MRHAIKVPSARVGRAVSHGGALWPIVIKMNSENLFTGFCYVVYLVMRMLSVLRTEYCKVKHLFFGLCSDLRQITCIDWLSRLSSQPVEHR